MLPAGEGRVYSAGADGFLGLWEPGEGALDRFQISPWAISHMVLRPDGAGDVPGGEGSARITQLAVAESGGSGRYRISVWDYSSKTKLFSLPLDDPAVFLSYSASGTFLMVATSGAAGLMLLDPENGTALEVPPVTDRVTFAVTGKSEKSMLSYSPSGVLSYWDFATGGEIRRFTVSRGLGSVLLFGSRRFFAGIGADGLSVFDAVSGGLIARDRLITRGTLAAADPESTEFFVFQPNRVTRYFLNSMGSINSSEQRAIPQTPGGVNSFLPSGGRIVLGGSQGRLFELAQADGKTVLTPFPSENQTRVTQAAVSGPFISFFGDDKTLGIIPADYRELEAGTELVLLSNADSYTRITPADPPDPETGRFIFWQNANTRIFPALWRAETAGGKPLLERKNILSKLPLRSNLRSVSIFGDTALFLTMRGVLAAASIAGDPDGSPVFNHQAPAASDAAFLNDREIIIGQGAVSGPSFIRLLVENGETVPMQISDQACLLLYRGKTALYGVTTGRESPSPAKGVRVFTRIVRFSGAGPEFVADYAGEDQDVSLTESAFPTANLGGETVSAYAPKGPVLFERSPGFPSQVMDGGSSVVVLDTEGNIIWYNPETGSIRARFSLYKDFWSLEADGIKTEGPAIKGKP
jgi:WD40 repeat protein